MSELFWYTFAAGWTGIAVGAVLMRALAKPIVDDYRGRLMNAEAGIKSRDEALARVRRNLRDASDIAPGDTK